MKGIFPIGSKVTVNNVSGYVKDIRLGTWVIDDANRTKVYHRYRKPLYVIEIVGDIQEQHIKGEDGSSLYVDDRGKRMYRLFPDEFKYVNFAGLDVNNIDDEDLYI